jgi:O-acetylhomoserine/O-acetylserine sulfhydrylase-like pyridoxal-dependent enzyme
VRLVGACRVQGHGGGSGNHLELGDDPEDPQPAESGVTDGLVRVPAGIEDWRDLLADFEQALAAIG